MNAVISRHRQSLFGTIVLILLVLYVILFSGLIIDGIKLDIPAIFHIAVYLVLYFYYLFTFRKANLLCFEFIFLAVYFLGMFFEELIPDEILDFFIGVGGSRLYMITDPIIIYKSFLSQMIGYLIFLFGCYKANTKKYVKQNNTIVNNSNLSSIGTIVYVLVAIILLFLVYYYVTGVFNSWFAYSDESILNEERNQGVARLTDLTLTVTVLELLRLNKRGVSNFLGFLRHTNKLYILEVLFISSLLLLSGNRNEMLLIFLPVVVGYSVFIKKISNRLLLVGICIGILVMIFSGLTRQSGDLLGAQFDLISSVQDFSLVGVDCTYLIKYTDSHDYIYFANFPLFILSGIPFIGPLIIHTMDLGFMSSSRLTTLAMSSNGTGLGTSLVGDLYYNGGILFVILFMFLFGYLVSYLYNKFNYCGCTNMFLALIYLYTISNSVYYVRQIFDFPISTIVFSSILIVTLFYIFNHGRIRI